MYFFENRTTELPSTAGRVEVEILGLHNNMISTLNHWIST